MKAVLLRLPHRRSAIKRPLEERREHARKRRHYERIGSRWLLGLAAVVLFVGLPLGVWKGPYLLDEQYLDTGSIGEGAGSAALVTGLRTAMVTCVASIGAGIALFYTARNYRLNHRGQVTERFINALERLDSERIYVRIGGILALEQIVRDSPEQATDASSVLQHFVREMRPPTSLDRPDADVQAALAALTRAESRTHASPPLDLEGLWIPGAMLDGSDLSEARLGTVNLSQASLLGADLSKAWLLGANLSRARLEKANLSEASLYRVDLSGACLEKANLSEAVLAGANLCSARLAGADLSEAKLFGANLGDAKLEGADLRGTDVTAEQVLTSRGLEGALLPLNIAQEPAVAARLADGHGVRQER